MDVRVAAAAAGLAAAVAGAPACARQAEPEVPREPGAAALAPALHIDDADDLLRELEKADAGIDRLHARILYDRTFELAGDRQVRIGELWFVRDTPASEGEAAPRRFAIEFSRLYVDRRLEDDPQIYVFDGEWLVEKRPVEKTFHKRQVVPAGQRFDPLKIGEGPLPIPIGQKREDIRSRFDASLLPPGDGLEAPADATEEDRLAAEQLRREVEGTMQLRLVPLPDTDASDDFREIRLWYRRAEDGTLLPRVARTVNTSGDVAIVKLVDIALNAKVEVRPDVFDTSTPAEGWDVTITEWRGQERR